MKGFFLLLKRLVPPYKKYLVLNIVMNILTAILNLFSFLLIIPILNLIFKVDKTNYAFMPFDFSSADSWGNLKEIVTNNFYWYFSKVLETNGASRVLLILAVYLIVTTVFRVTTMYLSYYYLIPVRTGVVRDLRNQINDKIVLLPLAFFTEERKGDIISRISGDVNEIEFSIMSSLDMLFKNPILILTYVIGMLIVSWQLTLFVLVLLPAAGYVMGQIGKKLKKTSLLGQQQWGLLISQVEETLSGLRIIKAFNAEDKITKRFHEHNDILRKTFHRIYRRQQLAHPMSELLGTVAIAIVLWYGGSLILNGHGSIEGASFIYFLTIFYLLINPAKDLSKSVYSIQKGLASIERIDKIIKAKSNIMDPEHPLPVHLNDRIEYKGVWFKYNEHWVIKGVNLEIPKGKTIALVGQSGSGKSTLADLLPRFYDVQEGRITIDGVDIKDAMVKDVRELMGIVNQEAILFNDTYFNNIAFGVKQASKQEVENAAKIANAHDFIIQSEHGYETGIGDRGCKLSGGQRQRISIARAVLKNPPVLILDEATSALDTESERLVQDALDRLMENRTTLVIAHRLSTIKNADWIYVMHEGLIVEQGTHTDLIALNGYYSRLCEMQSF